MAQPPGTVVRQSSDLVQRLLQVSQMREDSNSLIVPNEENRYILIVNNEGQHVLTRQSEVDDKIDPANSYEGTCIEDLWGHDIPTGTTLKDSMEMSVKNDSVEDKGGELFSIVLSTRENETQSPSTEMEHLRLSSPTSNENLLEIIKPDGAEAPDEFECFRNENRTGVPLPTINEESLKQLLYGTESG